MGIQFCGENYPIKKKKKWASWKAMLLSLSGMEEDPQAEIGRKEFWTFTQLELNLGFGKLRTILCSSY